MMTRPYIGPKAQTQVPSEVAEWVREEVERRAPWSDRRVTQADVYRDLIEEAYQARMATTRA